MSGSGSGGSGNFRFTFQCSTGSGGNSFIEPDPNAQDIDSESLSDSVINFPEEFGRTYHAYQAGSYAFPNDRLELERLDLQNETLEKLWGGRLFFAPLSRRNPPATILDVGTGTGDWAIKMADMFPTSQVIGTDLSPIQPRTVPPNVNFFVEDSSEPWEYPIKFDYVHTRVTAGCWENFERDIARQAFDNMNPGGYIEAQEFDAIARSDDGTLDENGPLSRWLSDIRTASAIIRRPADICEGLVADLEAVGFVDVQRRVWKMPLNGWPRDERLKELGRMWERNFLQGLSGFSLHLFHRAFRREPAEVEVNLIDVRREMTDTRVHAYIPIYVVTGRKPFPGERSGPDSTLQPQ